MENLKKILQFRDLFWQLTFREIKARYKQSILGYGWAILVPLLHLLVLSIVFSRIFRVPTGNIPYPIFLFVALVPWMFLTNSLGAATGSIIANASLITKVTLPREILPLSAIASKLVDLILTCLVLILFLIFYRVNFSTTLLLVPIIFLVQIFLIVGMSFFLSATNVFFRDIENVLGIFLTIWLYLTPVLYPSSLIPRDFQSIFLLNPMVGIIDAYRAVILDHSFPFWLTFVYSTAVSIFLLVTGAIYFRRRAKYFADVI